MGGAGTRRLYVRVAWLTAFLVSLTVMIMEVAGVGYKVMSAVDVILSILWAALVLLTGYFYAKVYFAVRKWNRTKTLPVNALSERKFETNIAYTTAWLTLFVVISGLPNVVVYGFRGASFLRHNSSFRWAETMLQLNSLFNPLLYSYRNRQSRKAVVEMLRGKKSQRIRPTATAVRRIRRRRYSETSLDVKEICDGRKLPRCSERPQSCGAMICSDTNRLNKAVVERPISAPSKIASDEMFKQQRDQLIVTVQIENAPKEKSVQRKTEIVETTTELRRPRHRIGGKIEHSKSLSENYLENATERNTWRTNSLPTISVN